MLHLLSFAWRWLKKFFINSGFPILVCKVQTICFTSHPSRKKLIQLECDFYMFFYASYSLVRLQCSCSTRGGVKTHQDWNDFPSLRWGIKHICSVFELCTKTSVVVFKRGSVWTFRSTSISFITEGLNYSSWWIILRPLLKCAWQQKT